MFKERSIETYDLGGDIKSSQLRLHLNEFISPHMHHTSVISGYIRNMDSQTIGKYMTEYNTYIPERFTKQLAEYVGIENKEHISVGAGSDDILRAILDVFAIKGFNRLLCFCPTYTQIKRLATLRGIEYHEIQMGINTSQDERANLLYLYDSMLKKGDTIVYICNPNNPTNDIWDVSIINNFINRYNQTIFIIDEAYIEYAALDDENQIDNISNSKIVPNHEDNVYHTLNKKSCAKLVPFAKNIIIVRTFSKAFGLAGLRIGFSVSRHGKDISGGLSVKSISRLSIDAASTCLNPDAISHYLCWIARTKKYRSEILHELYKRKYDVIPRIDNINTGGNYFLIHVGNVEKVQEILAKYNIIVRDRSRLPGLSGYIRISICWPDIRFGIFHDNEKDVRKRGIYKITDILTNQVFKNINNLIPPIQIYYTPKSHITNLRYIFNIVIDILNRNNIVWWIDNGTLLGAARHKGIIPWDNDIDISYLIDDMDQILCLKDHFKCRNLTLQRNRTHMYWQVGVNPPGYPISPVHIDIFPYYLREGKYINSDPRFREEAPHTALCNTSFTEDELLPLTELDFYEHKLPAPKSYEKVLERSLGSNWKTHGKIETKEYDKDVGIIEYELYEFAPA